MANQVSVSIGRERYETTIKVQQHVIVADEPLDAGGTDLGPSPKELLLSSLGTCKAITVRMYADRKGWPLEGLSIDLTYLDKSDGEPNTNYIHCEIKLIGDLDAEQRKRLALIADKCPVHKILSNPIVVESNFS
ncbi:OsmC family protein [Sphingobacterium sp. MYb382]|uniref:OsmC family protein n=1 Tax=Sphingobacterium sp. MYb382 TaxID=2745278 RepID=UPI0030A652C0